MSADLLPPPLGLRRRLELFTRTLVPELRGWRGLRRGLSSERIRTTARGEVREPVFVLGAPRSGTTFLGACLGAIPEISYHFEPALTKAAVPFVALDRWDRERSARFFQRTYRLLLTIHLEHDLRFAEKTPQNAFIVEFLAETFPDAQFVHILRDGRDAALSWSRKPWLAAEMTDSGRREPGGYRYGAHPRFWVEADRVPEFRTTSDLHRAIWGWRRHVEAILRDASDLPSTRYHELRYEDLVTSPDHVGRALVDFLGLGEPALTGFLSVARDAEPGSVGGWRRSLQPDDLRRVEREAGDLLRQLGY